jgi:hypothetical protein
VYREISLCDDVASILTDDVKATQIRARTITILPSDKSKTYEIMVVEICTSM